MVKINIRLASLKTKNLILILSVLTIMCFMVGASILYGIHRMKRTNAVQIRQKLMNSAKKRLNEEMDIIYNSIYTLYDSVTPGHLLRTSKKSLLQRANFMTKILTTFYAQNVDLLENSQIKQDLANIIASAKWGNNGYYFAIDSNGVIVAHPDPTLIGKKVPLKKIIEAIENLKKHPEKDFIFTEYQWKNPTTGKEDLKVVILKQFRLLHWYVGTGMYLSDLVRQKKKEAIAIINKTRYGKHGYFFLVREDGITITDPNKPSLNGKEFTIVMPAIRKIQAGAKQAFITYDFLIPGTHRKGKKLSLLRDFKPWHWVIGTGTYMSDINKSVADVVGSFNVSVKKSLIIMFFAMVVAYMVAIALGLRFSHVFITSRLKSMMDTLGMIKNGDFTREITVSGSSKDEIDIFASTLNALIKNLKSIIGNLKEISHRLSSRAEELSKASVSMSDAGEQSGRNMEEVAHAVSDMSHAIQSIAETVEEINRFINTVGENQREILLNFEEKVAQAKNNLKITESAQEKINSVEQSAKEIGKIVNVISEIADQTNLLALNAAIEAARAGEHGRGFAVVADEVRKLAEKTMSATEEIRSMIEAIQKQTKEAVRETNNISDIIVRDAEGIEKSKHNIESVVRKVDDIIEQVNQASASIEQLSATAQEINAQAEEVSQLIIDNAETIKKVAEMSKKLNAIAQDARIIVEQFKV